MGILDIFKINGIVERYNEEALYEQVLFEVQNGQLRPGLWSKALSECFGDINAAESIYIKLRVQSLKDESEANRIFDNAHNNDPHEIELLKYREKVKQQEEAAERERKQQQEYNLLKQRARNEDCLCAELKKDILPYSKIINRRFKISDEIIADTLERRIWTRNANIAGTVNFNKALQLVNNYNKTNYGGKSNWRIPDKDDFATLIDLRDMILPNNKCQMEQLLQYIGYINVKVPYYHWLSSVHDNNKCSGCISIMSGTTLDASEFHHVWLVSHT